MTDLYLQPEDVSWGGYKSWEGPYYRGSAKLEKPPQGAPFWDRVLWVISQTEGGAFDAVNLYDRCIMSAGLIQLCELFGLSTSMLRKFQAYAPIIFGAYLEAMPGAAEWRVEHPDGGPDWRGGVFYNGDVGEFVNNNDARRRFYLGGASGRKGMWSDEQKQHARQMCAALANMCAVEPFRKKQRDHVGPMMINFAVRDAKKLLFADEPDKDAIGYEAAMQCAFLSFAGNLPGPAWEAFKKGAADWVPGGSARHKCIAVLRSMTFHGIGIWPHRYNVIRPHLEEQFQVDLPDMADMLKSPQTRSFTDKNFPTTELWQAALVELGADLGPAGIDGKPGPKTRSALLRFEERADVLHPDGLMDPGTSQHLWDALELRSQAKARDLKQISCDAWGCVYKDDAGALEILMKPLRIAA